MDINPKSRWHNPEFVKESGGFFPVPGKVERTICELEPWDSTRRDMLVLLLRSLVDRGIPGDCAELGVYKGSTARLIHHYLPERKLHLFDTFEGFGDRSVSAEKASSGFAISATHFADTSVDRARQMIRPKNDNVGFFPGFFPDTVTEDHRQRTYSFVHLDADLYDPILAGLRFFYPRLSSGGFIVIHDYNAWIGARMAVDEFSKEIDEFVIPLPDKSGSALITKT